MKRIEDDADLVFLVDHLAPDHVRANTFGIGVKRQIGDVDVLRVVAKISDGALRGRLAVVRVCLGELIDLRHPQRFGLGAIHREHRLEIRRTRDLGDAS